MIGPSTPRQDAECTASVRSASGSLTRTPRLLTGAAHLAAERLPGKPTWFDGECDAVKGGHGQAASAGIGIVPGAGSCGYRLNISDLVLNDPPDGGMGRQIDDGVWTRTQLGVLPPGSHDIMLELAPGDGSWASAAMSDDSVAVLALNHRKSEHGKIVTSLRYSAANGRGGAIPEVATAGHVPFRWFAD